MSHYAVDKSILEVSAGPSDALPLSEYQQVLNWLDCLQRSDNDGLALDAGFALWPDYAAFGEDNYGLRVLVEKVNTAELVMVRQRRKGTQAGEPMVDGEWGHLDMHRRWLAAVAQAAPPTLSVSVANATHEGWHSSRCPSARPKGPTVRQVLESWLDAKLRAKQPATPGVYVPAPALLRGVLAAATPVGIGVNGRRAWEDASHRYEWNYQHGTVEVYRLSSGEWVHEATSDGTVTKTKGGKGRVWGKT